MIIKSLIYRSFQDISRLSFRNTYSIITKNANPKVKTFSQKVQQASNSNKNEINKPTKRISSQQQHQQANLGSRANKQTRQKQKIENNPFKDSDINEKSLSELNQEDLKMFEQCSLNIQEKKYEEAAKDLQEILDRLEEQKAHSDALQLLELQNSLYLYARKYMDAFLVRSNISKYMEYAPSNYQQSELQEQIIKYYYQLVFTHQLQAEVELDILYKNHYKTLSNENKTLLDLSIAVNIFN